MPSTLSASQQATYDSIFRHPVAHNLEWHSLIGVLNRLGDVEELANSAIKFSRNHQTVILHVRGKDVEVDEVIKIRRFLEGSEHGSKPHDGRTNDVLVVLQHSGARIFKVNSPSTEPEHIVPIDPRGHDQQVHNPKGDSGGKEGPYRNLFYEALVKHLADADRIYFLGDGQGASNEFEHFFTELREHHHDVLAGRIFGSDIVDISHMTDGELLAKSREFFSSLPG
jgi:hypothetical protein